MNAYPVKELRHFCNIRLKRSSYMPNQKIQFYDLTFVLHGRMIYYKNGERFEMHKGDAILLSPGDVRSREYIPEEVAYASFNFTLNDGFKITDQSFLRGVITEEIYALLSVFSQSHLSLFYHSEEKAKNMLNYIIFEIMGSLELQSNDNNVVKMIKYIDEHIGERITLSAVSEHVHLSREYTASIFKREMGKTVIKYVNERKMLIAKSLMREENISLYEIAQRLGFDNYGYFSRCFKKHFNTSPKQFQKMVEADMGY